MVDDDRNVLNRIVTGDKSWCFIHDPETKTSECNLADSKETVRSESENGEISGENNVGSIAWC
jgi:hypothetical protein